MITKLTRKEANESMMITFGRIKMISWAMVEFGKKYPKRERELMRLKLLVEKFEGNLKDSKLEENYFAKGGNLDEKLK